MGVGYVLLKSAIYWISIITFVNENEIIFLLFMLLLGIAIALAVSYSRILGIMLSVPFLFAPINTKIQSFCDVDKSKYLKLGIGLYYISGVTVYFLINSRFFVN